MPRHVEVQGWLTHHADSPHAASQAMFGAWRLPSLIGSTAVGWCTAAWCDVNLWLGRLDAAAAKHSATHNDKFDNLLLLLRGRKVFTLYHALDAPRLHLRYMRHLV